MPFTPSLDTLDFAEDMTSTVAIEVNSGGTGARWTPQQTYTAVDGLGAVPCAVNSVRETETAPKAIRIPPERHVTGVFRVLFSEPVNLDERYRLVWVDPDSGETRYLYVTRKSRNPRQLGILWAVTCVEYDL